MRLEYFQLIDRIVDIDIAKRSIAVEADVPHESTIFEGHFPTHPLMPGVLLAEAMAQTSGWLIIGMTQFERMPFLAAIKELKLRTFVQPGQKLHLTANLVHLGSGFAMTQAKAKIDGKAVCEASLTFRIVDFPNPEFRVHMKEWAKRVQFPMQTVSDA